MLYGTYDKVFSFIQGYQWLHEQSPSFPEIADGCQISLRTARKYVETLQRWGYLGHEKGKVRAVRILKQVDAIQ
jgi:DNA-binding IclR family transcriptional regulator